MRWLPMEVGTVLGCCLAAVGWAGESDSPQGSGPQTASAVVASAAGEPLHEAIDRFLAGASGLVHGHLAGDAEFFRRVSLDLIGMPPTADEVRAFLDDRDPEKRRRAVDRSLNDPRFARHLASVLSVMLLERRTSRFIAAEEWEDYMLQAVQENRPLNEVICEILSSDGTDANTRPAAEFFLAREGDPHLITRDVGRIIFGRDMECAQCHDHPLIDDYLQRDYHALLSVYSGGVLVTKQQEGKEVAYYGEQTGQDDVYESVFVEGKHVTGPRLPGEPTMAEPLLLPGEDQQPRDTHADVPRPVASRRAMLARAATDGTNRAFNENVANRLWAHMIGRGLVHPVDLHHSANPPAHPKLLRLLGERLAEMRFNVRSFLRELALTEVYQRSIDPPSLSEDVATRARARHAALAAEAERIEAVADASAAAFQTAQEAFDEAEAELLPAVEDYQAKRGSMVHKHQEAAAAAQEATSKLSAQSEALEVVEAARDTAAQVVERIPGDEAVSAAAKTFQERAAALAGEVTGLRTAVHEKTAALEQVTMEKAAATAAAKAAVAALGPLKERARSLETAMVEARQQMIDDYAAYFHHSQESDETEALLAWERGQQELARARQSVTDQQSLVAERHRERTMLERSIEDWNRQRAEVEAAAESLAALAKDREEEVSSVARQLEHLAAALSQVNDVKDSLGGDPTLSAAAAQLQSKIDELTATRAANDQELEKVRAERAAAEQRSTSAQEQLDQAQAELAKLVTSVAEAEQAVEEALATSAELAASLDEQWQELLASWTADGTIRPLGHLMPEQMCFSILQATGIYEQTWRQSAAELDSEKPLDASARVSPFVRIERNREIEQRTYGKLKGNLGTFVQLYSVGAGQPQTEFFASAEQALFAGNGSVVTGWTAPGEGNVTARMLAAKEPAAMATDLYLSVLSRTPSDEETAAVAEYVAQRPAEERTAAARELVWSLLTSAEFRFNH